MGKRKPIVRFVEIEGKAPAVEQKMLRKILEKFGLKNGVVLKTRDGSRIIQFTDDKGTERTFSPIPKELMEKISQELEKKFPKIS